LLVSNQSHAEAIAACEALLLQARDFETRNTTLTLLAWACLGEGRPRAALAALQKVLPRQAVDSYALAAVERASGQRAGAIQTLQKARAVGLLSRESARLLVDLYAEAGDLEAAFATTLEHLRVLGPDDAHLVVHALEQAEDFGRAEALSSAIDAVRAPIS
jgi:tetratricopeptide (TPR) repeat protein